MIKEMTLEEAYSYIQNFSLANKIDELTGIEYMVKYYTQLSPRERLALAVFMDETRKKS
jgi:uncharacterized protein YfkK (UPF0435 family)